MDQIQRMPFFRLLLPLVIGIVTQYYCYMHIWSIIALIFGLVIMLLSYLIPPRKQFDLRWLYGSGLYIFLFGIGTITTLVRQQQVTFTFLGVNKSYTATIIDIPQEKPNTFAYKVDVKDLNKKIVCYLPKDKNSRNLKAGDTFIFFSTIESFKNPPTSTGFDYPRYMHNKGYSGYSFIKSDRWEKTTNETSSILIEAVKSRQNILDLYHTLDLNNDEYSLLSAMTLGYKDTLSDDLVESFRVAGVAHILAISGMHVGIIYLILSSLFKFIPRNSRYKWIREIAIILFLWVYAFIIGFPPSAVRACIMLTLYSISLIRETKTYSLNTFFATAFLMLVWNPLWIFDLGFQLSFIAVFCMLTLFPLVAKRKFIKNKYLRYFWNIFLISIVVQIGTFPLCIYYFGTFPTYFFLSNILVIPLVTLLFYNSIIILIASGLSLLLPIIKGYLNFIPISIYKLLVYITTETIRFFEKLPYAQIQNVNLTFIGLFLVWSIIVLFIYFLLKKKAKTLILALTFSLLLISTIIASRIANKNTLNVYNDAHGSHISYYIGYNCKNVVKIQENKKIWLNGLTYFILVDDTWKEKSSTTKYNIDYLHILGNNSMSLYSLSNKFNIKKIILDSSLSNKSLKRFVSECEKLRIPYYDLSENGTLRIFF